MLKKIWFVIKGILDIDSVYDGSCCYNNNHDYPVNKGGDGNPSHFHVYSCWKCGKKFKI